MGGMRQQSNMCKIGGNNLKRKNLLGDADDFINQSVGAASDMYKEYRTMKSHNFKSTDDYYHCKANYEATSRGPIGEATSRGLGNLKENFDYQWNMYYKGLSKKDAQWDMKHDLKVNEDGRRRAKSLLYESSQDACADYRNKNKKLPNKYW